ncbi:MAG: alkylhydroperoxidase [Sulfuritalea sp.]|nr:alkylhydroperoxidase [Sulfuritalea sp.]
MSTPPISRYPVPKLEDLPADIRARILEVQEKSGFVPNVFLALAHRPAEWRAFFAYHDALMCKADITPRQKAMLDFAMKVALDSGAIGDADYDTLHGHGFNDEDIWDIGAVAAFFGLSNRMANMTAMRANDEFYLMGRVPKQK